MSLTRFFAKPTIYQESTFEVCETVISDNWKVDQRSGGDHRFVHGWLEPACVERIISTVWQSCADYEKTNVFADSVLCLGDISTAPVQARKEKI